MAYNIENFVRGIRQHGLNTAKNATLSGTNTFSGATTLSGTTTVSGAVTFSGAQNGTRRSYETQTGDDTLLAADSGKVFVATKSSATQTFTLPSAATAGLMYTFICGHADGEILINPITGQQISTKATVDGASVKPAAGTGIKNTAASNVVGDFITLVSDGTATWHTVAMAGTWASQ